MATSNPGSSVTRPDDWKRSSLCLISSMAERHLGKMKAMVRFHYSALMIDLLIILAAMAVPGAVIGLFAPVAVSWVFVALTTALGFLAARKAAIPAPAFLLWSNAIVAGNVVLFRTLYTVLQ